MNETIIEKSEASLVNVLCRALSVVLQGPPDVLANIRDDCCMFSAALIEIVFCRSSQQVAKQMPISRIELLCRVVCSHVKELCLNRQTDSNHIGNSTTKYGVQSAIGVLPSRYGVEGG